MKELTQPVYLATFKRLATIKVFLKYGAIVRKETLAAAEATGHNDLLPLLQNEFVSQ